VTGSFSRLPEGREAACFFSSFFFKALYL